MSYYAGPVARLSALKLPAGTAAHTAQSLVKPPPLMFMRPSGHAIAPCHCVLTIRPLPAPRSPPQWSTVYRVHRHIALDETQPGRPVHDAHRRQVLRQGDHRARKGGERQL